MNSSSKSEPEHFPGGILSVECDDDLKTYCGLCLTECAVDDSLLLMRWGLNTGWTPVCLDCSISLVGSAIFSRVQVKGV
jgi:hypothetical protein